jgi:hypothetical protein
MVEEEICKKIIVNVVILNREVIYSLCRYIFVEIYIYCSLHIFNFLLQTKMKNKVIVLGTLMLAVLGVIAFTTKQTDAYRGDPSQVGPNHTEEREAQMEVVFENLDYDGWVEIMTEDGRSPGVLNKVNEDNFEDFVEARELAQEGNLQEANQIKQELGLGQGEMKRNGGGQGKGTMARDGECNR